MQNGYYLYILTNKTNTVLYIGITNNLSKRIWEHKNKIIPGFTSDYNVNKLVYFEKLNIFSIKEARVKEKQVKKWNREWKIKLIKSINPNWENLEQNLFKVFLGK